MLRFKIEDIEEGEKREPKSFWAWVASFVAIGMSSFQIYTAAFGLFSSMIQRSIHLLFAFMIAILLFPALSRSPRNRPSVFDLLLIGFFLFAIGYLVIDFEELVYRVGLPNPLDLFTGAICIFFILEMSRRTIGFAMPILSVLFFLYAIFGSNLPGMLGHKGYSLERTVSHIFMTSDGIFGIPLGVSATFVALFILFSSFLEVSGAGNFFITLANSLVGRFRGGPAKVAVIASSCFGTISGSAAANVVGTGTFTIPMMKSIGYKPHFAGAVEAVASTGGMIMPPVMGAGAFVMAEFLGISYFDVAAAAAIPAILYYVAAFAMVHLEAVKNELRGIPREKIPRLKIVLKEGWHLLFPLGVLIYLLGISRASPMKAAFWSIVALFLVSLPFKNTRVTPSRLLSSLEKGAQNILPVASACACAGIIVGVLMLTGLALRFSTFLVEVSGGNLPLLLLLTMVASVILGMGLPATACYILLAVLAAPAIIKLGVNPLAAHLFVFYFGCISNITPPVAMAAFAASGIAQASPNKIGYCAMRLGIAGFIVPFMFVYGPALILKGTLIEIVTGFITAFIGAIALAAAVQGWFLGKTNLVERVLYGLAAILLIKPGIYTDIVGFILSTIALGSQKMRQKKQNIEPALPG